MRFFIIILMFILLGALLIISNNNLALEKQENLKKFGELWIQWIDNVFGNFKEITGNAVKMDWVSG